MSAATTTPHAPWPTVKLGDVCEVRAGATHHTVQSEDGIYPVFGSGGYICQATEFRCPANTVTIGRKGTLDKPLLIEEPFWNIDTCFGVIPGEKILSRYLWRFCQNFDFYHLVPSLGRPSTNSEAIKNISIPLPPLEVQREIVAKVEAGLKEADGLVAHFKRLTALADDTFKAELDETFSTLNAPTVKLGDVCKIVNGFTPLKSNPSYWVCGTIPWFTIDDVRKRGRFIYETQQFITSEALVKNTERLIPPESVLLCCTASIGEYAFTKIPLTTNQQFNALIVKDEWKEKLLSLYLYEFSKTLKETLIRSAGKTTIHFVSVGKVSNISIPLPSLDIQREIVGKLEAVKARCKRLKAEAERGLKAAEALRKAVLAEAFEQ